MHHWNVTEIELEAWYFGHKSDDHLTITCRSVSFLPAVYGADDVAADGGIMPTLIDRPSILVRGVDTEAMGTTAWSRLRFKDSATGEQKEFNVQVMDTIEPNIAKFEI